jgi:hypothetical protein
MKRFLFCILFFNVYAANAQCTPGGTALATSYVSNNSNKGEMFNVVATNAITVICFDLNLILGSTGSYEIYYKVGSYVGSENNAAAWTLIGSNPSVPCVGFDFPSPMNIPVNLFIPAGQTYAFYVTATNVAATTGIRYTNNAGYTNIASDANVSIAGGIGKAYPFLTSYPNRSFNGTLHYGPGNTLPIELIAFYATPMNGAVRLNWSTASETQNAYFTVERSGDGLSWKKLKTIDGAGSVQQKNTYEMVDEQPLPGISYYRLSQTDFDHHSKYFPIKSVERPVENPTLEKLSLSPNPANSVVTISGTEDELGDVSVTNLLGENLTEKIRISRDLDAIVLDLSALENQMLVVKCGNRSALLVKQ